MTSMNLRRDEVQYATWDVRGVPERLLASSALEVKLRPADTSWLPMERVGSSWRILLAGPDATIADGNPTVVATTCPDVQLRFTNSPEDLRFSGGKITIV